MVDRSSRMGSARQREIIRKRLASRGHPYRVQPGTSRMKGFTTYEQIRADLDIPVEQRPAVRAQKRLDRRIELTGSVYRINTEPGKKFHKNTRVINLVSYEDVRNAIERRKKPK